MASTLTQNPASTVAVGFEGAELSLMIRDGQNIDSTGQVEYIQDEGADDKVAVVSNKGERHQLEGTLKNGQTAPKVGDTVTIGTAVFLVEQVQTRRTSRAARISMTVYKNNANAWTTA